MKVSINMISCIHVLNPTITGFQCSKGWKFQIEKLIIRLKGVTLMVFLGGFGGHSDGSLVVNSDRSDPNPNTS